MDINKIPVTSQVEEYRKRGYSNDDILPKTQEKRNMGLMNYFTLWMGSVHNIPNYLAVGVFLIMGRKHFSRSLTKLRMIRLS